MGEIEESVGGGRGREEEENRKGCEEGIGSKEMDYLHNSLILPLPKPLQQTPPKIFHSYKPVPPVYNQDIHKIISSHLKPEVFKLLQA